MKQAGKQQEVTPARVWVGVDIGKDSVTIARSDAAGVLAVANTPAALATWLASVPAGSAIAMESTNTYHEVLASLAHALGLRVHVLSPRRTYHYARARGQRGKTDRVDASLILQLLIREDEQLPRWQPAAPGNVRLRRLLSRRAQLVRANAALRQTLAGISELGAIRRQTQTAFKALIARMDALILKTLAADPVLAALHARFKTIVGVGDIVAAQLVQALTRVAFANADAFVAFTGLDPRPHDSGQHCGRRRLTKQGPPLLRHLLYVAAMSAARTKLWHPTYARLRARGLASTEAIIVLARRIARIAFALFKSGAAFDPDKFAPHPDRP